jgi:hypothetical protein
LCSTVTDICYFTSSKSMLKFNLSEQVFGTIKDHCTKAVSSAM